MTVWDEKPEPEYESMSLIHYVTKDLNAWLEKLQEHHIIELSELINKVAILTETLRIERLWAEDFKVKADSLDALETAIIQFSDEGEWKTLNVMTMIEVEKKLEVIKTHLDVIPHDDYGYDIGHISFQELVKNLYEVLGVKK